MEEKKTLLSQVASGLETLAGRIKSYSLSEEGASVNLQAEVKREDGVVIYTDADEFAPGVSVFVKEGEEVMPAPDGDHKLEDGRMVVVADGMVAEIKESEEMESKEESEFLTKEEFSKSLKELCDVLSLQSQALSEIEGAKSDTAKKLTDLTAELSKVKGEKEALETKLNETPAATSVKASKKEKKELTLSAAEIAALPTKEYVKLCNEHPELIKKR